ncbi:MAG: protein-methionine-sulfoxide reductase catalytic subunit MsrP [Planctomycetota bacterium]|nr:MAG: protein-methionine-sulfoxide reductase catalytic subunit MsrP [Planctomycetota bacterium]
MHVFTRRPWDPDRQRLTPPEVFANRGHHRRAFLAELASGALGVTCGAIAGCGRPDEQTVRKAGAVPGIDQTLARFYPAPRNPAFRYERPETRRRDAAEFCNFYEFTGPYTKAVWRYVDRFQPLPWQLRIDGLCSRPTTLDVDALHARFRLEERAYRHRCVETWAMCVPWTGFPLAELLRRVEPLPRARYVRFVTASRPEQMPYLRDEPTLPWPYTEGLTLAEATNPLTFLALGVYGEPLLKQHGAPVRLVVPWKYGFKSIKSLVRIELTDSRPATFWNTVAPHEYDFTANVDPEVPHPRWPQTTEWMLGTRERYPTQPFNGYGRWVADLYH